MSEQSMSLLSANDLALACREILLDNKYTEHSSIDLDGARLFENAYNVVTVASFETWGDYRELDGISSIGFRSDDEAVKAR